MKLFITAWNIAGLLTQLEEFCVTKNGTIAGSSCFITQESSARTWETQWKTCQELFNLIPAKNILKRHKPVIRIAHLYSKDIYDLIKYKFVSLSFF